MWLRSRPSSWLRVKSLGTAMIAVFSCRVTGSLGAQPGPLVGLEVVDDGCHA